MLRATHVQPSSGSPAETLETITMDYTARHRRRVVMTSDAGLSFLLDLPQAMALRNGDGLVLEDGRVIKVLAKSEPLMEIRGYDAKHLTEIAYQIGNRHLEAQIEAERILIRRDHVIRVMLLGLDAMVRDVEEIFEPLAGAYGHHH
jgi:urease accessory protein